MQACVKVIAVPGGATTQTVTGIVDADGAAFVPKAFLTFGLAAPDAIAAPARQMQGFDNGAGSSACVGLETNTFFGLKGVEQGGGSGSSLIDETSPPVTGSIVGLGAISAVRSGEVDITYSGWARTPMSFILVCLGGSALNVSFLAGPTAGGAITTGFPPVATIVGTAYPTSPSTTYGGNFSYGWATSDGQYGALSNLIADDAGNARYQVTDKVVTQLESSGAPIALTGTVTNWGLTSLTFGSSAGGSLGPVTGWAFGGINATAGAVSLHADGRSSLVPLTFAPQIVIVMSGGAVSNPSLDTTIASWSVGATDGVNEAGYWTAEDAVGPGGPTTGAHLLTTTRALSFATSLSANTTTMSATCHVTLNTDANTFEIAQTTTDGIARQILWLALGAATAPTPTPTTYVIRRLRRFMLPWDDANRQKFISRIELIMQTGIGTAAVTDPKIMCRLSGDGGDTWGNESLMSAGEIGAYSTRVYLNRLGRARNPVVEITVSDAVDWQFLQCLADIESGVS